MKSPMHSPPLCYFTCAMRHLINQIPMRSLPNRALRRFAYSYYPPLSPRKLARRLRAEYRAVARSERAWRTQKLARQMRLFARKAYDAPAYAIDNY